MTVRHLRRALRCSRSGGSAVRRPLPPDWHMNATSSAVTSTVPVTDGRDVHAAPALTLAADNQSATAHMEDRCVQ